jgi:hypothetical protein
MWTKNEVGMKVVSHSVAEKGREMQCIAQYWAAQQHEQCCTMLYNATQTPKYGSNR